MKKFMLTLFCWLLITNNVSARMVTERNGDALIVKQASAEETRQLFNEYQYDYTHPNAEIPRIFFKRLPTDWKQTPENENKNRTFIRILLPLVLKVNEEILQEREKIIDLIKKYVGPEPLSAEDKDYIETMAEQYSIDSKIKDDRRFMVLLRQLMEKVDAVPPSIMISTAIIYTNWGTSRLAIEANSLYKEEVWYTNQGLKPEGDEDADYRYKIFTDLEDSIRQRALKINSHINYDYFRHIRKANRNIEHSSTGVTLAAQMMFDSNLKNVAGLIDYTLTFYDLDYTDNEPILIGIDQFKK